MGRRGLICNIIVFLSCTFSVIGAPLSFSVSDPSINLSPRSTAIFTGKISNATGVDLSATDLALNAFGFDPAAIMFDQLLGIPDFSIASESVSSLVPLFSVSLGPDALPRATYPLTVTMQDSFGDESIPVEVLSNLVRSTLSQNPERYC